MSRLQQAGTKRRGIAALTVVALALGLFGLSLLMPATANIAGSSFNGADGIPDTTGGTRTLVTVSDKPSGNTDDTYAGDGAAEPDLCPSVDLTHSAPQKSDITNFSYGTDTAAPGVLYLAWNRKFAGGTLAIDFEFNQGSTDCGNGVNPVRTEGDLMVVYEFDGGTVQDVQVRTWTAGAWSSPVTPVPAVAAEASISADQLFGELSIDLSHAAFQIFDPVDCKAFTTGWAKSRTGNSFTTSKVKDFVAPRKITVSNCGSLTIVKDAQPNAADDFGFTAAGDSATYGADVPASFVLDDDADATRTSSQQIIAHPQNVTVTEDALVNGWQLRSISCTGTGAGKVATSVANRTVQVALASTDDITCTYVNAQPSTLTIVKDAVPDNGRDFAFAGTGTGVAASFSLDDDSDATLPRQRSFSSLADGTYTVTEGAATGWSLTGIVCSGATVSYQAADGTPAPSSTWAAGHDKVAVTITAGQSPTCTFTNTKTMPTISTTKTATPTTVNEPGATVRFDVSVQNTSPLNVTITDLSDDIYGDVTLLAPPTGGTQCALGTSLAPGATYSCSFVAPVTGNAGSSHTDVVSATAVDTDGVGATDSDDAVVIVADVLPQIAVTKTPSATTIHKNDSVTYTYVVTNPGVDPLTVTMADDKCSPVTGPTAGDADADGKLDPSESWTFSCTTTLATTTTNVVTAAGTDDEGNRVTATATATVVVLDPAINVTKAASAPSVHVGDAVTYTYNVTNTGTATPLTNVTVVDDKCSGMTGPTGDGAPVGTLSTGETWVYTCTMPLTAGTTNVVTASGKDALDATVTSTATATVIVLDPKIDVTKMASATTVHAGDQVTYTYVVTNPGNTPLASVTVTDDKCATVTGPAAGGDADGDARLDPGETWTYTCASTLTATTVNVATATGVDALDEKVSDTATARVVVIKPVIAIDKAPSATSVEPGTTVVYTYTVTNPGDVPLTAVTVTDDKCSPVTLARGDANGDGILQVTETWVFTCSQVQTGAVDTLTNVGTARGLDPLGAAVTSKDTVTISVVAPLVLAQPPAPAPAPVATAPVTLPRTGIDVRGWLQLGGSLLLLGVALLLTSRSRRTA